MKGGYKLAFSDFFPVYGALFYMVRNWDEDNNKIKKELNILKTYNATILLSPVLAYSLAKGLEKLIN